MTRAHAERRLILLSPAERLVFNEILNGFDSATIAELLGLSYSTVRNQTIAVFRKFGVSSRLQLVVPFVKRP